LLTVLTVDSKLGLITNDNTNSRWFHDARTKPIVRKPFDINGFAFYRL